MSTDMHPSVVGDEEQVEVVELAAAVDELVTADELAAVDELVTAVDDQVVEGVAVPVWVEES